MTAACSGGAGDIVYSIPVMRALCVTRYFVKVNYYDNGQSLYGTIKSLLESQGFACLPTSGSVEWGEFECGLKFDYNIDSFRFQRARGTNPIVKSIAAQFEVELSDWSKPWLHGIEPAKSFQNLIHVTSRWRERSTVKWSNIITRLVNRKQSLAFIGLESEYDAFCIECGREIPYLQTANLLQMAQLIQGCEALYCNQSVALTIAQGLGKTYFIERKPNKTNCLFYTQNENILR